VPTLEPELVIELEVVTGLPWMGVWVARCVLLQQGHLHEATVPASGDESPLLEPAPVPRDYACCVWRLTRSERACPHASVQPRRKIPAARARMEQEVQVKCGKTASGHERCEGGRGSADTLNKASSERDVVALAPDKQFAADIERRWHIDLHSLDTRRVSART